MRDIDISIQYKNISYDARVWYSNGKIRSLHWQMKR